MLPLNYAILKYYTTIEDACATDVIAALKGQYGRFKALSRPAVIEAQMTAEVRLQVAAFMERRGLGGLIRGGR